MKALEQLNNVEKAKLLHQLFPSEIPAFIEFVKGMCAVYHEHEHTQRQQWENGLFSFDFWLSLVAEAESKIKRYNSQIPKSSNLFAGQLFAGYIAMYMVHCLMAYTTQRVHTNDKFTKAVDVLFNY